MLSRGRACPLLPTQPTAHRSPERNIAMRLLTVAAIVGRFPAARAGVGGERRASGRALVHHRANHAAWSTGVLQLG